MKSSLKICDMRTMDDVNKIRRAIAGNEGVVACEISREKKEATVIYDGYFVNIDDIIESIERLGYTVI